MRPILVFDVNETLLDIAPLAPHFARLFGEARALRSWFAELILYSEALTLSGQYAPFGEIGAAALRMLGDARGVEIRAEDVRAIQEQIATLPAHADVPGTLEALKTAGFRLVAFTNNPAATLKRQMQENGLADLFAHLFSVDDLARAYKPSTLSYRAVEQALGAEPGALMMIACHSWDCLGAAAAGWQSALVTRPGNASIPVGVQPDLIVPDMIRLAAALLERHPPEP